MKIFRFTFILVVLLNHFSFSQQKLNYNELDKYIATAVKNFNIPGLAIGLIKNDTIVFSMGYGFRNIETKAEVNSETIFGVASVSKAFTAACIGILVDEGKINWDDKVVKYLPWFALNDKYVTHELTIRDLLSHRSGLGTFDGDLLWYGTNYSRKEILKRVEAIPLKHSFRSKYGYQNLMFIAAGEVVEAGTGKTWDEFLNERIFKPLAMKSSNTSTSVYKPGENWSIPHINGKPDKLINYDNSGPAASINSNVSDLLKWLQLWLNNGKHNDDTILSAKSIYTILSPQLFLSSGPANEKYGTHFRSYGMGWVLWDYAGRKIAEHSGGLPGVHTKVAIVPEDNIGIVILSNQINYLVNPLLKKILDFFFNDKEVDYAADALKQKTKDEAHEKEEIVNKEKSRVLGTSPSLQLQEYTGIYGMKFMAKQKYL